MKEVRGVTESAPHRLVRRRWAEASAIVLIAAVVATGCSSRDADYSPKKPGAADTLTAAVDIDPIEWGTCDEEWDVNEGFQCATITVPLDYAEPDGTTIDIAVSRWAEPGSEPTKALLLNPGGPGGSGLGYANYAASSLTGDLGLADHAVIGFDPRGVGQSTGVRCLTDAELDLYAFPDTTPDTPEEEELLDKAGSAMADACIAKYGEDLLHYSTENTARDMEMIRRAMGLATIDYLGVSYGTYLGGVFATLFPESFSAMVLDAAFDPQGDTPEQEVLTQAEGFEKAMNNWIEWCEDAESSCAFAAADVGKRYDDLYTSLDESPVPNADGRIGNQSVLSLATVSALYSRDAWPLLASALASAEEGDPAGLFSLADNYNERDSDGTYSNSDSAGFAIRCASGFNWEVPKDPEALLKKLFEVAPRFSRDTEASDLASSYCEGVARRPDIFAIGYRGDAPVIVIGGTDDPATPFRWSEEMTANMGPNAVLVTFEGEGHGQVLGSDCIDGIIGDFFGEGTVPDEGQTCQPDQPVEEPSWWADLPGLGTRETSLDAAVLGPLIGLSSTDAYAEYRAFDGSAEKAYDRYSTALADAGFVLDGVSDTYTPEEPSFFLAPGTDGQYLGIYLFAESELTTYNLVKPSGPVPAGTTLVVLYYYAG